MAGGNKRGTVSEHEPNDERLLYRVRIAAAAVTTILFVVVVLADREPTTVGLVAGAMFVLFGIVSADYIARRGNGNGHS